MQMLDGFTILALLLGSGQAVSASQLAPFSD